MSVALQSGYGGWLRPTVRQLWQHYVVLRPLVVLLLSLTVVLQWTTGLLHLPLSMRFISTLVAVIFALTAPALLTAQEHEGGTRDRLLLLPGSRRRFMAVHAATLLLGVPGIVGVGFANGLAVNEVGQHHFLYSTFEWLRFANAPLIAGFTALIGFRIGGKARPLLLGLTTIGIIVVCIPALVFIAQDAPNEILIPLTALLPAMNAAFISRRILGSILFGVIALTLAWAAMVALGATGDDAIMRIGIPSSLFLTVGYVVLGNRWMSGGEPGIVRLPEAKAGTDSCPRGLKQQTHSLAQRVRDLRTISWRSMRTRPLYLLSLLALAVITKYLAGDSPLLLPIVGLVCGIGCFAPEQYQNRFRFLRDRGIAPSTVWLARQRIWLVRCIAGCGFVLLVGYATIDVLAQGRFSPFDFVLASLTIYSISQACSLLFRQPVIAIACSVGIVVSIGFWVGWVFGLGVPMWVCLPVILVSGFYISWTNARNWMDEKWTNSAWLRTGLHCCVIAAVCYVGVASYRILEIPNHYSESGELPPAATSAKPNIATPTKLKNANDFLIHCGAERSSLPPIRFYRLDKAPIAWEYIDQNTQMWTFACKDRVPLLTHLIHSGDFYFQGRKKELTTAGGATFDRTAGIESKVVAGRYLGILLIELKGAERQHESDLAGALKYYETAVQGLWKCVSSDNPGRDLVTAFAHAGRIVRRAAQVEFLLTLQDKQRPRSRFSQFERNQPDLATVSAWIRDLDIGKQTTKTKIYVPRYRSRGVQYWLPDRVITQHDFRSRIDPITFGIRGRRLANWLHERRLFFIEQSTPGRIAEWVAETMDVSENYHAWRQDEHCPRSIAYSWPDAEPIDWLIAKRNFETDIRAAQQLSLLAAYLRSGLLAQEEPLKDFPGTEQRLLLTDPWTELPFEWYPNGVDARETARLTGREPGWGTPAHVVPPRTPFFKSRGLRSVTYAEGQAYETNEPRIYAVPYFEYLRDQTGAE